MQHACDGGGAGAQTKKEYFCRDLPVLMAGLTCEDEGKEYLDRFAPLCCSDGKPVCGDKDDKDDADNALSTGDMVPS